MTRLDLKLAERTTSFPMEAFCDDGRELHRRSGAGARLPYQAQEFRLRLRKAAGLDETRRDFYRAMARLGLGREAVVIAIKP